MAHYLTKEVRKGVAYDFSSESPMLHLVEYSGAGEKAVHKINLSLVKAIFFVKDHEGNSIYKEKNEFEPGKTVYGKKIAVDFHDGETIVGYSISNPVMKKRFFMVPVDANGNNTKIFINTDTIKDLKYL